MKYLRTSIVVSSLLLAVIASSGCSTADSIQKTNTERISSQRAKIGELRSEDKEILSEIDSLLAETESLLSRAERMMNEDEDKASLLLDAAHSVLVEANTRKYAATRKISYEVARQAYNERATKIRALRDQLERQLPSKTEANQ